MIDPVFSRCRILIVDDEESNVHLITRTLTRAGYTELKALYDSRDVLDVIREWSPDLLLMDLHMPHMDGIALLGQIRGALPAAEYLPVLVLTADVSHDALVWALSAGANDFLTKPFHIDEVLLRVRSLLAFRLSYGALRESNSALATTLRQQLERDDQHPTDRAARRKEVEDVLVSGPTMVYQAIIALTSGDVVGYEALSRFDAGREPARWFLEAAAVGLGAELELSAIEAALKDVDRLEAHQFMAVNASPAVLQDERFADLVRRPGRDRLVVEVTEHEPVANYDELIRVCKGLREDGIKVAVDDAGAGYASMRHILMLGPDIIKFDIALTRQVDHDPVKRALAASLLHFAEEVGALITAEGIETQGELATLRSLGVPWGQGFHLALPGPLPS
ncbi:MAG TPA: EAL domain-containing protein [Acidimicrobiales bacterium]|jgi:EAL domain-containing protein (putative c-di-GMP-specific phosphodiesterase class I)